MQITKGEWTFGELFISVGNFYIAEILSTDSYNSFRNVKYPQPTAAKANAKLIAAAPDMLNALMNLENDNNAIPDHAWKLVQDAIKKAI
jgi:hypothetical protein